MSRSLCHASWVHDGLVVAGTVCGFFAEGDQRTWMLEQLRSDWCPMCLARIADWTVEAADAGEHPKLRPPSAVARAINVTQDDGGDVVLGRALNTPGWSRLLVPFAEIPALLVDLTRRLHVTHAPPQPRLEVGMRVRTALTGDEGRGWHPDVLRQRQAWREAIRAWQHTEGNVHVPGTNLLRYANERRVERPAVPPSWQRGVIIDTSSSGDTGMYFVCHHPGGHQPGAMAAQPCFAEHVWYGPEEVAPLAPEDNR